MSEPSAFSGFPQAARRFLAELSENNNREWFEAHKQDYRRLIIEPALAFTVALGEHLRSISPGVSYDLRTNGSGSMMRIYRDTRFSEDKTPYKTNLGIVFWEGSGKKTESPGFYFHMDAEYTGMFAGVYRFPQPLLSAYREAVAEEQMGSELAAVVERLRGAGYTIGGAHYKRVPRGYDASHARADLLRYNGLTAAVPSCEPELVCTPHLVDACLEHCRAMAALQRWLAAVQKRSTA
jgi:uncharacterized protein (TIGR02453 family)